MKADIRKLLAADKVIIGTDRVLKAIQHEGAVTKVILASNAPADVRERLERYQPLAKFKLQVAEMSNDELGTLCKKPFSIAALAVKA